MDCWFQMIVETTEGHRVLLRGTFRPDGTMTRHSPHSLIGAKFHPHHVRRVLRVSGGGWDWEIKRRLRKAGWPVPFEERVKA